MDFGLDQADKIASVVGALAAVIALVYTVRQAAGQRRAGGGPAAGTRPPIWLIAGLTVAACVFAPWGLLSVASHVTGGDPGPGRSSGAATSADGRTGGVAPAEPAAAEVLWKGDVRLDSTPRDFDFEPPARGNTSTDLSSDGYLNGSVYDSFWGSAVVLWTAKAEPSRNDCATRLQTHGVNEVKIDVRSRLCLETNEGRVVFIKVLRRDGDGYDAQVTLWSSS